MTSNNDITSNDLRIHQRVLKLMGNRFEMSVVSDDEQRAHQQIDAAIAEIQRIEKLLTTFEEGSQTNLINQHAGIRPVNVDREILQIIQRSIRISELTQGAFDITYGSIDKSLWNFDRNMTSLPSPEIARQMIRLINYKNIEIDESAGTVFLKEKGMRIGFGGIGKGYAAEQAKKILKAHSVTSGIVNASGDLTVWGTQPNGSPWTIGIANPDQANAYFSSVQLTDTSIATSGNYEKYVIIDGVKYSHTINPKTGLPVRGIKSVTIITPNAEFADALATPINVMGIQVGLDLVNQLKDVACIIIDDINQIHTSKNIKIS